MSENVVIENIINTEWDMFHSVNEGGPKADCQNDRPTFEAMRRAQFEAWSEAACESYYNDLMDAVVTGRNLDTEKYIHMMKTTSPSKYDKLAGLLKFPDERGMELVSLITEKMLEQTVALFEKYPYVSGYGRPLRSSEDWSGNTSIETYQRGELMTYSNSTMELLYSHILDLEAKGVSFAKTVLENGVKYYGYACLEDAEAAMKKHADAQEIEVSFGCDCGCGDFC